MAIFYKVSSMHFYLDFLTTTDINSQTTTAALHMHLYRIHYITYRLPNSCISYQVIEPVDNYKPCYLFDHLLASAKSIFEMASVSVKTGFLYLDYKTACLLIGHHSIE